MEKALIAVIGGGASGLMAAYAAAKEVQREKKNATVMILEANDRVGKKLLATGNGKCNLSNENISQENYYHWNTAFWETVYSEFPRQDTVKEFEKMGLITKSDDWGRIYPMPEQASAVVDSLRAACRRYRVEEKTGSRVTKIIQQGDRYRCFYGDTSVLADAVIYAAGGKAGQNFGTDGSSFELLKGLGIKISPMMPSLVPLKSSFPFRRELKGVRVKAKATLLERGARLARERGEVQFTDYGLSGIVIMNLSRYRTANCQICLDFAPDYSKSFVQEYLEQKVKAYPDSPALDALNGMVPKKLGQVIMKLSVEETGKQAEDLSAGELERAAGYVKCLPFPITESLPFENAQVTCGGVLVFQLDGKTMEVKGRKNFYIAGEAVDIDGTCGGYNLQWAWSSGYLAGKTAGKRI